MKRLIYLPLLALSACVALPPVADTDIAAKLSAAVGKYERQGCRVTGYRNDGHQTDGGMSNLFVRNSRKAEGLPPIAFTAYIVRCNGEKVYAVELPDDEANRVWSLECTNRAWALAGGDCINKTH